MNNDTPTPSTPTYLGVTGLAGDTLVDAPSGAIPADSARPGVEVLGTDGQPALVQISVGTIFDASKGLAVRVAFDNGTRLVCGPMTHVGGFLAQDLAPGDVVGGRTVLSVGRAAASALYDVMLQSRYPVSVCGGVPVHSSIFRTSTEVAQIAAQLAKEIDGYQNGEGK